jgi:hypothetical protein
VIGFLSIIFGRPQILPCPLFTVAYVLLIHAQDTGVYSPTVVVVFVPRRGGCRTEPNEVRHVHVHPCVGRMPLKSELICTGFATHTFPVWAACPRSPR